MIKDKYEISLWQDILSDNGLYMDEKKLAVIGSDTMTAECRAIEPCMVENINGTHTFTFKMFYTYRNEDPEAKEEFYQNPFLDLLVNERKIKVFWKDKWYDLVIKNCQEDSSGKSVTYTCTDLYINELSKTGFNLEFNQELENNQGTASELAAKVLKDTDWIFDEAGSDIIQQEKEEPVYETEIGVDIDGNYCESDYHYETAKTDTSDFFKEFDLPYKKAKTSPIKITVKNLRVYASATATTFFKLPTEISFTFTKEAEQSYYDCEGEMVYYIMPESGRAKERVVAKENFSVKAEFTNNETVAVRVYRYTGESSGEAIRFTGQIEVDYRATVELGTVAPQKIESGSTILVYYNQVQAFVNSGQTTMEGSIQFAYAKEYQTENNTMLVINADCYKIDDVTWAYDGDMISITKINQELMRIPYKETVSTRYRAKRFVESPRTVYDPVTKKYCYRYEATADAPNGDYRKGAKIYKYEITEFNDPTIVVNSIVNAKDFISTEGWRGDSLIFELYPPYNPDDPNPSAYEGRSYMRFKAGDAVYNGIFQQATRSFPDGLTNGNKYIFRYKAMSEEVEDEGTENEKRHPSGHYITSGINPIICEYEIQNDEYNPLTNNRYFEAKGPEVKNGWVEFTLTCTHGFKYSDFYMTRIGLFLNIGEENVWLKEAQFFPLLYGTDLDGNEKRIEPEMMNVSSVAVTKYKYYLKEDGITNPDDIKPLYDQEVDWDNEGIKLLYNDNFEKIRSIEIKESNRFNILQTIAETFECWVTFDILHDSTGKILFKDGKPQKFVRIKREVGTDLGLGFIYGIDLSSVRRTIQSDQIVTKTIVLDNSNEFGKNGFCTIKRSLENPSRDNFIIDFDYYVNHGLLDREMVYNDLYGIAPSPDDGDYTYLCYFDRLKALNISYDKITEQLEGKRVELSNAIQFESLYGNYVDTLNAQIADLKEEIYQLTNVKYEVFMGPRYSEDPKHEQDEIRSREEAISSLQNNINVYTQLQADTDHLINDKKSPTKQLGGLKIQVKDAEEAQKQIVDNIKALNLKFYTKYGRYIQEGTWQSEEYMDDNLYYLDALDVAYTSSRPQVSYDISVLRVSSLEDFENKQFHIGDIAFVQDTEFFGYVYIKGVKTPYKEKVLISEITSYLDEPEKDVIKVQNYKTQFEDLFQRISATTQSLQYATGQYSRAANGFINGGLIDQDVLAASLRQDGDYGIGALNGAVNITGTGILVNDINNINRQLQIDPLGISITEDGGINWKRIASAEGITTQALTLGKLDTNNIAIVDGDTTAFRWDSNGISAYYFTKNNDTTNVNFGKFVRFDKYGLYGIDGIPDYVPASEADIWRKAQYGLTWKGFFLKNAYGNGYVSISSDNDFQVMRNDDSEVIKIGALEWLDESGHVTTKPQNSNPTLYGIRIRNNAGKPVFTTGDDGNLTLTGSARSSNFSESTGWQIDKNGDAIFNNITARGAIKTAVFEYAEIQAVGGVFLFRPSSTIKSATISKVSEYDLVVTVEKPVLFKEGNWCKISNYTTNEGHEPDNPDTTTVNGLRYVYEIGGITTSQEKTYITLTGAAELVTGDHPITTLEKLEGGALVDMGYASTHVDYHNGIYNYGIGVNSSDNSVDLPARAISLFETNVHTDQNTDASRRISYSYKAILGTLPRNLISGGQGGTIYNNYIAETQGLFADTLFLGDENQFIAAYSHNVDGVEKRELVIKGNISASSITIGEDETTVKESIEGIKETADNTLIFDTQCDYVNSYLEKVVKQVSASDNPSQLGLYEYNSSTYEYTLTEDTAVQSGKVYYEEVTTTGQAAEITAYVYRGGNDVSSEFDFSCFTWSLKTEEGLSQLVDKNNNPQVGRTVVVPFDICGYGAEVIATFTPTEDAALQTTEYDDLTNINNQTFTARSNGESVRVRDLTSTTTLNPTDQLMIVGAESEKLATIQTLQDYLEIHAGGADKHYTHIQGTSSDTWEITHNLGKFPSVTVVDSAGTVVVGECDYINLNKVIVKFNAGFSGKAYLN